MRFDNGAWDAIWELLPKILILYIVTGCTEYTRALVAAILQFLHLRNVQHPVWLQVQADVMVIMEEDGEIAHSMLARSIQANSHRGEIHLLNKRWRTIGLHRKMFANTDFIPNNNQPHEDSNVHHQQQVQQLSQWIVQFATSYTLETNLYYIRMRNDESK